MSEADELYAQIARMDAYEVAHAQIAASLGLTLEQVERLMETEEYQRAAAAITAEQFERQSALNNGWDSVEAQALTIVNNTLAWTKDPEYALKAAAVANKAQRRGGGVANTPLQAPAGARVVIALNQTYVKHLTAAYASPTKAAASGSNIVEFATAVRAAEIPKIQNAMGIDGVRSLMQAAPSIDATLDELGDLQE